MKKIFACAAVTALFMGCACGPKPVLVYKNSDPDPEWFGGVEVHRYQRDSLAFAASFQDVSWDYQTYLGSHMHPLNFLVEVRNLSGRAEVVDPTRFSLWVPEVKQGVAS